MGWEITFESFPILETERFELRKIRLNDASNMYSYLSKDEVVKYYDLETFTSKQQVVELIESLHYRYQTRKQLRWGITWKNHNTIIGTCGLHALEKDHLKAEIGYELHPEYWGRGVMTEVIQKVVKYGFNEMNLNRIEAFYHPLNIASKKVLEKNGFRYEGLLRKRFFEKGKYIDAAITAVLKEDLY
jgi:[ribosomal protein S5]-alanine N-acetyltransferase